MLSKNKILAMVILLFSLLNVSYADNKGDILSDINKLETNLKNLRENYPKDLENKAISLSKNYNDVFTALGYKPESIDYLYQLGKISSNFKNDLITELNSLTKEISEKSLLELNNLSSIKNNINLNYSTISDSEKVTFLNSIKSVENNYTGFSDSFSGKINTLNNKYTQLLSDYKNTLKTVYNANSVSINKINDFSTKFTSLNTLNSQFEKNYSIFRDTYLKSSGNISEYSKEKQLYYVDLLRKELEKNRDINIKTNKSLENSKLDIDRFINLLVENFQNSLSLKLTDTYGIIYSDEEISTVVSKINILKSKYSDSDGKIKATEVNSDAGVIDEVVFLNKKLNEINLKMVKLIGTGNIDKSIDSIKIDLENDIIIFYNSNIESYKNDLLLKIKEKLNIVNLESKNILLFVDAIDLRYTLLNDKISSSKDLNYIKSQINDFKDYVSKYNYLKNEVIDKKIETIDNSLSTLVIKRELENIKYAKMSKTQYDKQLNDFLVNLKSKQPEKYRDKLKTIVTKIDKLLDSKSLSDNNRFVVLILKLNILKFLN